jgi:hypothetical protein
MLYLIYWHFGKKTHKTIKIIKQSVAPRIEKGKETGTERICKAKDILHMIL